MFTVADIRNIAVQIERNGEEAYRKAGRLAEKPEIAGILAWMADEEHRHAQWFASIRSAEPLTPEQRDIEEMGRSLLQNMVRESTFLLDPEALERAETVKKVFAVSKKFERDTIVFYEFLLGLLEEEAAIQQMQRIIEEERRHLLELERLEEAATGSPATLPAS